jgi:hypothetical protein
MIKVKMIDNSKLDKLFPPKEKKLFKFKIWVGDTYECPLGEYNTLQEIMTKIQGVKYIIIDGVLYRTDDIIKVEEIS